jgi:hypothetical protein
MPDRVHAAMQRVQSPDVDSVLDRRSPEAEVAELAVGDDAMLLTGEFRNLSLACNMSAYTALMLLRRGHGPSVAGDGARVVRRM